MSDEMRCPDCGRPRPKHHWEETDDEFCVATGTMHSCQPFTIARLRSQLAAQPVAGEKVAKGAAMDSHFGGSYDGEQMRSFFAGWDAALEYARGRR